jgi:hypothetical protein
MIVSAVLFAAALAQAVEPEDAVVPAAKCSMAAGVRLDDGRSSADIIARGALSACSREMHAFEAALRAKADATMSSDVPADEKARLVADTYGRFEREVENMTIEAILKWRAKK